jgi:hypothetical protein
MRKERKPDLAADNYRELEAKVDALMAADRDRDRAIPLEKPNLPMDDKKLDVKIIRDTDPLSSEEEADDSEEEISLPSPELDTPKSSTTEASEDVPKQTAKEPKASESIDAPSTDDAVEEIELAETSRAVEDESSSPASAGRLKAKLRQLGQYMGSFWQNKTKRNITLVILGVVLIALATVPATRYWLLNTAGVRVSTSVTVIDNSSSQPLRNVSVSIGDIETSTNEDGYAKLEGIKLGRHDLQIERRAFAPRTIQITLGWGSNPLGQYWLYPTGAQYAFVVDDYVSSAPIHRAEVISDEASAFTDEEGFALLTTDVDVDVSELEITIVADGYREESLLIDIGDAQQQDVRLVPELKHFFTREADEGYEVVASHIDGQNESIVLPATGAEREDTVLLPHPTKNRVAVVSTRDDERNEDGFLLSTLTIVDLEDDKKLAVTQSERIQLIGWFDDRVAYVQIAAGASGMDPNRHQMMSYNYLLEDEIRLASGNYFNAIARVNDFIYFAPSSIFRTESTDLKRIRADGSSEETVMARESWSLYRSSFDTMTVATSDKWFTYNIFSGDREELEDSPDDFSSKLYTANPWNDNQHAVVLLGEDMNKLAVRDADNDEHQILLESSELRYPIRWLNDTTLVYRIDSGDEVADYAISTVGEREPIKIRNVAKSSSIERWFSY